ncbi:MAG: hypothetical protein IT432_02800 [Phycisphaerales bacterium]|nr:hypothetical protein [Phycisphaerales bacterium]
MTYRQSWYILVMLVSGIGAIAIGAFAVSSWWDWFRPANGWHAVDLHAISSRNRERFVIALGFPRSAGGARAQSEDTSQGEARIQRAARFSIDECQSDVSHLQDHGRSLVTPRAEWTAAPPDDWRLLVDALESEYRSRGLSNEYRVALEWTQATQDLKEFTLTTRDGDDSYRSTYRAGADLSSVLSIRFEYRNARTDSINLAFSLGSAIVGSVLAILGAMIAYSAMRAAR